jgi:hypothetical protein
MLRQLLGLYPLAETILAQAAFLVVLGAGALWYRARSRTTAFAVQERAAARSSHPEPVETR